MIYKNHVKAGMTVSPHVLASQAGVRILQAGGHAVEAAIAMASTLCVVYPHMTGIGGDAFWLLGSGEQTADPICIDASGCSGEKMLPDYYAQQGYAAMPFRGPQAASTMAGAVSGWQAALTLAQTWSLPGHKTQTLTDLFAPAIAYAENGFPVSSSQAYCSAKHFDVLRHDKNFSALFFPAQRPPQTGTCMRLPRLAVFLKRLALEGLQSFYTGAISRDLANDFAQSGGLLTHDDFFCHRAETVAPLRLHLPWGTFYNSPPPTQGIVSLLILAQVFYLIDGGRCDCASEPEFIHAIVEATKQAFFLRNSSLADPRFMQEQVEDWLHDAFLNRLAENIDMQQAAPWKAGMQAGGDTVWFGATDKWGNTVSCIQSIYHEFGSGFVLPGSGLLWHNRGLGFSLDCTHRNCLAPRKKPLHTLNPAMARLSDGRVLCYGSMGGDGQPQTQAAVLLRYLLCRDRPCLAVNKPRWLLGRSWGEQSDVLKIEDNFSADTIRCLKRMGHELDVLAPKNILMGHAGLLVRYANGRLEGGADYRSDGAVCSC